jgi:hypothetical protein
MSLNKMLMDLFNRETACQATYQKDGAVYHTLKYVDWLENRAARRTQPATEAGSEQPAVQQPQPAICFTPSQLHGAALAAGLHDSDIDDLINEARKRAGVR